MIHDSDTNPQLLHDLASVVSRLDYRVRAIVVEKRKLVIAPSAGPDSDQGVHLMLHWPTLSASSQVCRVSEQVARLIDSRCFERDRPFFLARYPAASQVAIALRHDIPSAQPAILAEHLRAISLQSAILHEAFSLYGIHGFAKWIGGELRTTTIEEALSS